jgi:hypothetical protein
VPRYSEKANVDGQSGSGTINALATAFQTDVTTSFTLERNAIAGLEHGLGGIRVGGIRKLRVISSSPSPG